jgi:hypothetical protein
VNFAPRVKIPVLMLNGRFDFFYPPPLSQEPMFQFLGTPAEHKRRIVYETSHALPRNAVIKDLGGHLKTGHHSTGQNRPPQTGDRDDGVLLRDGLRTQIGGDFRPPAAGATLQHVRVM